jgi:Fur family transcriptional regulator, ferric uptake regulator
MRPGLKQETQVAPGKGAPAGAAGEGPPAQGAAVKETLGEALSRFERFLAGRDLRLTAARRAIIEAVLARSGHFPIEDLVADLRRRGIRGSKATVYRALPLLTEAGILQSAVITGDTKSYEAAVRGGHHDHLVCRPCGRVVEFEFEAFEILQREIAARHGFRLEGHLHQLVGTCPECQAKEAARAAGAAQVRRAPVSLAGEAAADGATDETTSQ